MFRYQGIRPSSVSGVVALAGIVGGEELCPSIGLTFSFLRELGGSAGHLAESICTAIPIKSSEAKPCNSN